MGIDQIDLRTALAPDAHGRVPDRAELLRRIEESEDARRVAVQLMELAIEAREKAETTAYRESESRLRRLLESFVDIAIITTSPDGIVESWNPGAESIFGYAENEIVGQSADILFTPQEREADVPGIEMKAARENGRAADERWHLRKDGSEFYASGVMAPLVEHGRLIGYAKIARDLTKDKQIEADLQLAYDTMEARVDERTAELARANVSLKQQISDRQRAEEERVGLLRRVVTSQEEERSRIARDMHDHLGQQLTALRLKIATLAENSSIDPKLAREIEGLQEAAARLDSEVGFLAWELRPAALDDLGFIAATRNFVAEWSRHYNIGAELHAGNLENQRLAPEIETNLYRIAQEALNNVYKHAQASSVNIVVERRKEAMVLIIEDDGQGFDLSDVRPNKESGVGLGLVGMRERAGIIGGTLEIESAPGKGTTIFVRVPLVGISDQ